MFMCRILSRIYDVIWDWPHKVCAALDWAVKDGHYVFVWLYVTCAEKIRSCK